MSDQPSAFAAPVSTDTPEAQAAAAVAQAAAEAAAQASAQPAAPVVPTIAAEFVGEGKKYSTVEAALSALPHAQSHIENLEAENKRLRDATDAATKLDDAVARLEAERNSTVTPTAPEYDPAKIREEAKNVYKEMSVEEKRNANVRAADQALLEKFGDKRQEVTANVAKKLGVSVAFLEATAAASPAAFLKLVADGSSQGSTLPKSEQSTINSDALNLGNQQDAPTAKVGKAGNTKDLVNAWKGAGEIVANKNK